LSGSIRVPRRSKISKASLRYRRASACSPSFWLNLQLRWNLYPAEATEADVLKKINPVRATG
jgi:plasmid maintenance system antidote protein VapI